MNQAVEDVRRDYARYDDIEIAARAACDRIASVAGGYSLSVRARSILDAARDEVINTPETADFMSGVPLEAAHQRERWGSDHDAGKTPFDWFGNYIDECR